eukprot:CAMPEP_0172535046 /NCGR_PEP_ID=MMETSP1067-20121228/7215_1 /TAXON_ID=265564 ORGANISM="Thalassiosira punctigera, Strain Tpunct2005C2" /NCGR_SAMPLE_ID=MMETSP1067 /ASSEMBLY_ACC=CAM_ASM_000444 /LENGTH=706 /DNA_ID=CAMNT_0013319939 /DNA_START=120 /DNA_END=2240 /DNA_ORIENTATION=-
MTVPEGAPPAPSNGENDDGKKAEEEKEGPPLSADEATEQQQRQAVVAPLPLDWTRMNECDAEGVDTMPIRYPWDVFEIDPADDRLEVVGTHGQKITRMGGDLASRVSPDLTHLVLRSHLVRTMEGVAGMKKLEVLELYDNMVDELRELDGEGGFPGRGLKVLDISYNVIRDMGPVALCPNLQDLYIAQNKIKSIKGIKHLKLLRKIDLGANRIRVMDGNELSGLENLEELWLGKNKIEKIEGLSKLTKLRRLDVQSNRLTSVENLEAQVNTLEELYLANNGIEVEGAKRATGLALKFSKLSILDLTRNRLTDTTPFSHMTSLTDLWISGNDIKTFEDVEPLGALTELDSVYLEYNPVASEFEYRKKLAEIVPSLTQIDANMIGGLAQHGYASTGGGNLVERMRQMQEVAIQNALQQAEGQKPAAAQTEQGDGKSEEVEEDADGAKQHAADKTDEESPVSETETPIVKTEENGMSELNLPRVDFDKTQTVGSTRWMRLETLSYHVPPEENAVAGDASTPRKWDRVVRTTKQSETSIDAVVVLAILRNDVDDPTKDEIVCVRQFRPPVDGHTIELPAGLIDADEDPASAAEREFQEETGYVGKAVDVLPASYLSPGLTNESASLVRLEVDMTLERNRQIHNDQIQNSGLEGCERDRGLEKLLLPRVGLLGALNDLQRREGAKVFAALYSLALGMSVAEAVTARKDGRS